MAAVAVSTRPPASFRCSGRIRLAKYLGALALLIPIIIYMYYVVIEAWCLGYAYFYLTGDLMRGSQAEEYTVVLWNDSSVRMRMARCFMRAIHRHCCCCWSPSR